MLNSVLALQFIQIHKCIRHKGRGRRGGPSRPRPMRVEESYNSVPRDVDPAPLAKADLCTYANVNMKSL